MDRQLTGKRPNFGNRKSGGNPYKILFFMVLIAGGIWLIFQIGLEPGNLVKPFFLPTPTPTRTAGSYILAAEAYFDAGKIDDPIDFDATDAYRRALDMEPDNVLARVELARLLTYSSSLLSSQPEKIQRLSEARAEIEKAVEIAPEDSTVLAIQALAYDWSASVALDDDERQMFLVLVQYKT